MKLSKWSIHTLGHLHWVAYVGAIGIVLQALPAAAQVEPAGETVETAPQVSAAQLNQTVEAYLAVNAVQQELQQALAGVTDQDEIQRRTQAAHPEMMQAVTDAGLDYETYSNIINAINRDEALRQTFFQRLNERQGETGPAQGAQAGAAADFTDQELVQAAEVYQAVTEINQELRDDLDNISDPDAIQARVAEAEQAMLQSAANVGIDTDRYGEIMHAVQHDEALAQRLMQIMQQ